MLLNTTLVPVIGPLAPIIIQVIVFIQRLDFVSLVIQPSKGIDHVCADEGVYTLNIKES